MGEIIYEDGDIILTSTSLDVDKGRVLQLSLNGEYVNYTEKEIQIISNTLKEWLNKDFDARDECEQKIGELQEKTLECGELAREVYRLNKNLILERVILKDIIEDLRKAAQKVGWIDTRV